MNKSETVCDACSQRVELNIFEISNRGYLSNFDGDSFKILLCEECVEKLHVKKEWFDNNHCLVLEEEGGSCWVASCKHEEDVLELIQSLTQEAQQRIEECENIYNLNQLLVD